MVTRRGKIARLPLAIREEVNRRLLEGEPYKMICRWLNALPETLSVLDSFGEQPIDEKNMSDWKAGGYADWLHRRESIAQTRELSKYAVEFAKASGGNLTEGAAAILSGKILEVLEDFSKLQPRPEDPDPKQISETVQAINTMVDAISSLRSGDHDKVKLAQNEKKLAQRDEVIALDREKFQRDTAEMALKILKDDRAKAIEAGVGTNEEKLEIMGQHLFGELWKPRPKN